MGRYLAAVFVGYFAALSFIRAFIRTRERDSWWEHRRIMSGDGYSIYAQRQINKGKAPPSRGAVLIFVFFDVVVGVIFLCGVLLILFFPQ